MGKGFKGTGGHWFVGGGTEIISMPEQVKIAKVSGNSYAEAAANAKLMARAPEMLEMLECLHERLGTAFEEEKKKIGLILHKARSDS